MAHGSKSAAPRSSNTQQCVNCCVHDMCQQAQRVRPFTGSAALQTMCCQRLGPAVSSATCKQASMVVRIKASPAIFSGSYWPSPLRPQLQTLPVSAIASVWLWPQATDTTLRSGLEDRKARRGKVTCIRPSTAYYHVSNTKLSEGCTEQQHCHWQCSLHMVPIAVKHICAAQLVLPACQWQTIEQPTSPALGSSWPSSPLLPRPHVSSWPRRVIEAVYSDPQATTAGVISSSMSGSSCTA